MKRSVSILAAAAIGLAGGLGGYWLYQWTRTPAPIPPAAEQSHALAGSMVDQKRPDFSLRDLDGKPQDIGQWDRKVVLLNFWATWCPPCRREIPALIELQQTYADQGLQVVGVALDQTQLVEEYRDTMAINYPVLVGESDALAVSKSYGNAYGQLPYSVIIDRSGTIHAVHRGELSRAQAEALIKPLL